MLISYPIDSSCSINSVQIPLISFLVDMTTYEYFLQCMINCISLISISARREDMLHIFWRIITTYCFKCRSSCNIHNHVKKRYLGEIFYIKSIHFTSYKLNFTFFLFFRSFWYKIKKNNKETIKPSQMKFSWHT